MTLSNKAIIIYGPPGAGKGTQAELLARRFQLIHFDTGKYLESLLNSDKVKEDKDLMEEKRKFDAGELISPAWVLNIVKDATDKIGNAGLGIVYSGSPRTVFEAFGNSKEEEGLLSLLENIYGKNNIKVLFLNIDQETSVNRNSSRLVCSLCGLPILASSGLTHCALCGAKARKRSLDKPEIIKNRWIEYKKRTLPIIDKMKDSNYKVFDINGEHNPEEVHRDILGALNKES